MLLLLLLLSSWEVMDFGCFTLKVTFPLATRSAILCLRVNCDAAVAAVVGEVGSVITDVSAISTESCCCCCCC